MIGIDNPNALGHLAEARQHHPAEEEVRVGIRNMFKALGMGPQLARQVRGREADILVADYNCVVETKTTGKANPEARGSKGKETQKEQLFDYVDGLREELRSQLDYEKRADKPWVGILTDGQSGWIWRWEEQKGVFGEELISLRWKGNDSHEKVLENICKSLEDIEPGKKWIDPEAIYEIFREDEKEFGSLYDKLTEDSSQEITTKFELWLEMLQGSGMAPTHPRHQHNLFVKHCFLIAVAKAVIAVLTPETDDDDPQVVLRNGFTAWLVDTEEGIEKSQKLFDKAKYYDWRLPFGDVLRTLYEQCIDKDHRKIYGEYYTPDWVAQQMAEEILDNDWIETATKAALESLEGNSDVLNGIGILDPACGSGTFLYHAARRIMGSPSLGKVQPEKRALVVARLVHGIDIHPVAVEMAKATLLRALPPVSREGINQNFSTLLNITQGDSLLTAGTEIHERLLIGDVFEFISPKRTVFNLPLTAIRDLEFRNFLPKLVEAARNHSSIPTEVPGELKNSLKPFLRSLTKIIDNEGDSVWTWYILNTLGPFCLSERKVNRILANPPWVRVSNIQVESRKREVEDMAKDLKLWARRQKATGFDIAALFIHRCRNLYLDELTGKAAWITNNAAIKGGNWEGFREQHEKFLTKIIDYGKLKEPPFKTAKSCALIQGKPVEIKDGSEPVEEKLPITGIEEKVSQLLNADRKIKIDRQEKWEQVRDVTYLENLPEPIPKAKSKYIGKFKNGATIFPHCLLIAEEIDKEKNEKVKIKTRRSTQKSWKNIEPLTGKIPERWVLSCIFSNDLLPFAIRPETTQAIIPLGKNELVEEFPEKEPYWSKAEKLYEKNKGIGKTTPKTLLDRINFNSALKAQLPFTKGKYDSCRVVYNKSGQYLRAARCDKSRIVVENACYWCQTNSAEEAQYLVSLLNAQCLQDAYGECRKSDRDFHTYIWDGVPIPYYNPKKRWHKELATLCIEAENFVAELIPNLDLNYNQKRVSREIKNSLQKSGISERIDEVVKKVLPEQAR